MDTFLELSPDSSTPHTPSPRSSFDLEDMHQSAHFNLKLSSGLDQVPDAPRMLEYPYDRDDPIAAATAASFYPDSRGSYLSDLYDDRMKVDSNSNTNNGNNNNHNSHDHEHDLVRDQGPSPDPYQSSWHDPSSAPPSNNGDHPHHNTDPHFYAARSYPRHDPHDAAFIHSEPGAFLGPYSSRSDAFYGEPLPISEHMPLSADPSALHGHPIDDPYLSSASASPHSSIHEFDSVDSAHSSPVIVPTQAPFFRPGSSGGLQHPPAYINPHAALPVMHTDDAASKETQYLRRRCFNCHTTEPPSWRRSTLNPGKIVCNKCGLYERTHLRPRPHRFDELRAGSKARKAAKAGPSPGDSPKSKQPGIKKEPNEGEYLDFTRRRGSVSSVGSNGVSEWESGSAYSASSSAPNSGYNSPIPTQFAANPLAPHSRPSSRDGGPIRLPNAPLTDIATRLTKMPPAKASSAPYYIEGRSTTLGRPLPPSGDYFGRRASLPSETISPSGRLTSTLGMPEVTGWQVIPPSDLTSSPKSRNKAKKAVAV